MHRRYLPVALSVLTLMVAAAGNSAVESVWFGRTSHSVRACTKRGRDGACGEGEGTKNSQRHLIPGVVFFCLAVVGTLDTLRHYC